MSERERHTHTHRQAERDRETETQREAERDFFSTATTLVAGTVYHTCNIPCFLNEVIEVRRRAEKAFSAVSCEDIVFLAKLISTETSSEYPKR